jgi:predicted ATPase
MRASVVRCRTFVGRMEELATLVRALDDARRRRGSWVTVLGEAGIGKTRLSAELARLAEDRGDRVAVGRCSPVDRSTPYRMLSEALIQAAGGVARPDDQEELVPYLPAVVRLVPQLARDIDGILDRIGRDRR